MKWTSLLKKKKSWKDPWNRNWWQWIKRLIWDNRNTPVRKGKWSESRSVMSDSLRSLGLHSPWNSPGQNTGVGSRPLLQGIFPTQGLNPGLPYCRWILYQLSHQRSPRILEWAAYPFSSWSSGPKNWTRVSCTASWFFTNRAIRGLCEMNT